MPILTRVDHLNVQVPPDREEEAVSFYRDLIGFKQLKKPDSLGPAGGHFCISETPGMNYMLVLLAVLARKI